MKIKKVLTKNKWGIEYKIFINNKLRFNGVIIQKGIFHTLKEKVEYETICLIKWFKGTTEYKNLLSKEA